MKGIDVASTLLEQLQDPALVFVGRDTVWNMNCLMEQRLPLGREDLVGRSFIQRCVIPEAWEAVRAEFAEVFAGQRDQLALPVQLAGGRVTMELEVQRANIADQPAVLGLLRALRFDGEQQDEPIPFEAEYTVSTESNRGQLLSIEALLPDAHRGPLGAPCYRALHGRRSPCPGCPVFERDPLPPWSRSVVKPHPSDHLTVVTVRRATEKTVTVHGCTVRPRELRELIMARVTQLADRMGLSVRERDVLQRLLEGSRLDDIGKSLGIGARTVKFHQANVLKKLGLDSRRSLFRLVL